MSDFKKSFAAFQSESPGCAGCSPPAPGCWYSERTRSRPQGDGSLLADRRLKADSSFCLYRFQPTAEDDHPHGSRPVRLPTSVAAAKAL